MKHINICRNKSKNFRQKALGLGHKLCCNLGHNLAFRSYVKVLKLIEVTMKLEAKTSRLGHKFVTT